MSLRSRFSAILLSMKLHSPNAEGNAITAMRLLIVDDSADTADMLVLLCETEGIVARAAYSGEAGLRVAREFRPDVVLCDIGLPDMSGHAVARELRSDQALRSCTLLALSGYGQARDKKDAMAAGFDAHLTKPAEFPDVITTIRRLRKSPRNRCVSSTF
jgi:CheY-like chemotaxis protein